MEQRISLMDTPKGFMDGLMKTGQFLNTSVIDKKLLHLIEFRVSQINGCAFCLDMHYKDAIHLGETQQRLYSLPSWPESPFYTDSEKAALRFAEEADDQLRDRRRYLRSAHETFLERRDLRSRAQRRDAQLLEQAQQGLPDNAGDL
ncbi:carboxymuconolactone decarboxylase family protein [Puia sp. P3]|uniref:carboxymuconolactone decarboxylase family protein n=1 Tax=Puia sp. P3 TaxID=3423952 RepID=UPI003D66E0E8